MTRCASSLAPRCREELDAHPGNDCLAGFHFVLCPCLQAFESSLGQQDVVSASYVLAKLRCEIDLIAEVALLVSCAEDVPIAQPD